MKTDSATPLRMLCISPLFAPAANAEAFCATKMALALQQSGVSLKVLSSSNLYGGPRKDGSRLWKPVRDITVDLPQPEPTTRLHSTLSALQYQTPFYARWVSQVVKTVQQLHQERRFDLVYSRSLPMAAHIAGFWCSRKLKLPWVVNINDPWDFHLYGPEAAERAPDLESRGLLFWLRRTLRHADLITYPCKGLHEFHTALAGFEHRAELIPHIGYKAERASPKPDTQFRLVHAGMLGTSDVTGRSTQALLEGLKAFIQSSPGAAEHTKLVLVGPSDSKTQSWVSRLGLESYVESAGQVDYEESLTYIASASACILIEAAMEVGIFFPSKLADYLVSGKPVLALSPRTGVAADLAGRGEMIRVDHDPLAVRDALASLYSDFQGGTLASRKPGDALIAHLQERGVAEKLLGACRALTSPASSRSPVAGEQALPKAKSLSERLS